MPCQEVFPPRVRGCYVGARGLYQIRYTYDKDHTHLLEMLQYLLYTVRYDRLYLDHLENNDKGNR